MRAAVGIAALAGLGTLFAACGSFEGGEFPLTSPGVPERGATGDMYTCDSGGVVQTVYDERGEDFHVVGVLGRFEPGAFQVQSPVGLLDLELAESTDVRGEYFAGDLLDVRGVQEEDGTRRAESVNRGCRTSAYVYMVATPTPGPTAAPAPDTPASPPLGEIDDKEDGDKDDESGGGDDDDRGNGRGRGNGGGRRR